MLKSLIVSAVLGAGALAGGQYAVTGAVPFTPPAVSAPASVPTSAAQLPPVVAVTPVSTCGSPRAAQAPAQASKAADVATTAPEPVAPQAAAATPSGGGVNLNTATAAELESLPGIGAKTAARIIASRPIASVDAVQHLPGVTGKNYALFASKVTV